MKLYELRNRLEILYNRSWKTMRALQRFSVPDLIRTTGLGFQKGDSLYLMEWITTLLKHNYLTTANSLIEEPFEIKQYILSRNVGPKRPIWCPDCYAILLPLNCLPVVEQIRRDSFWFMTENCKNIYIGATDPDIIENYGFDDHYINVTTYKVSWLGRSRWDHKGYYYAGSEFLRRAINRYDEIKKNILLTPFNIYLITHERYD